MVKLASNPVYIAMAVVIVALVLIEAYLLLGRGTAVPVVANGDKVSVYYTGTLTNGTVFGSNFGQQPLQFTVGKGQVIPGFDQAVIGMSLNQTKNVTIPANQAYGPVNPTLIISVSRHTYFGNQTVVPGTTVTRQTQNGPLQGIIVGVNATNVTINFNSPLAGRTLDFKIQVIQIIKANSTG